jgi:hypothetical protein
MYVLVRFAFIRTLTKLSYSSEVVLLCLDMGKPNLVIMIVSQVRFFPDWFDAPMAARDEWVGRNPV